MSNEQTYPKLSLSFGRARVYFFALCGIYGVYIGLLALSIFMGSDIQFQGTWLYEIVLMALTVLEYAAFCWAFAHIIFFRSAYGTRAAWQGVGWFSLADGVRYGITFLLTWRMEGIAQDEIALQLGYFLEYALLDVAQVALVFLLTHLLLRRGDEIEKIRADALRAQGLCAPDHVNELFSTYRMFSFRGVVSHATLLATAVNALQVLSGRVLYDIGQGAPTDAEDLAWMVFYYTSDIAKAVLCCVAIRWICLGLYRRCRHS